MTRYQPRSLAPLPMTNDHNLRAVIDELRATQRPPGEHITFPEIQWPAVAAEPPPPMQPARPRDVPLVVGMIEPSHGRWAPWVFWSLVAMAFACVLARAEGWL